MGDYDQNLGEDKMAFSAWINMGDDAKGESLDKDHTDWIDITWCGHQIIQPRLLHEQSAEAP